MAKKGGGDFFFKKSHAIIRRDTQQAVSLRPKRDNKTRAIKLLLPPSSDLYHYQRENGVAASVRAAISGRQKGLGFATKNIYEYRNTNVQRALKHEI